MTRKGGVDLPIRGCGSNSIPRAQWQGVYQLFPFCLWLKKSSSKFVVPSVTSWLAGREMLSGLSVLTGVGPGIWPPGPRKSTVFLQKKLSLIPKKNSC